MSDHRPPYHRRQTRPIPRVDLAPISAVPSPDTTVTLEPCPECERCTTCSGRHWVSCPTCGDGEVSCAGCKDCLLCLGAHAVEPVRAAKWRALNEPNNTPTGAT